MCSLVGTAALLIISIGVLAEGKPKKSSRVPRTEIAHPCSRVYSRTVRKRFENEVARRLQQDRTRVQIEWPDTCPFNPVVDLYGWHELNKSRLKKGTDPDWQCNYTGKVFKSEHYIDLHMERMFTNATRGDNGVCLANYCEVLGFCRLTEPSFFESLAADPPECDPILMAFQQNMCIDLMDNCFSEENASMNAMRAKTKTLWCNRLTCDAKRDAHDHNRNWSIIMSWLFAILGIGILACIFCQPEDPHDHRHRSGARSRRAMDHPRYMKKNQ